MFPCLVQNNKNTNKCVSCSFLQTENATNSPPKWTSVLLWLPLNQSKTDTPKTTPPLPPKTAGPIRSHEAQERGCHPKELDCPTAGSGFPFIPPDAWGLHRFHLKSLWNQHENRGTGEKCKNTTEKAETKATERQKTKHKKRKNN